MIGAVHPARGGFTHALRGTWHAYVATWRAIARDRAAILLFFVGGIVYSFFYPLPYSKESVQRVPIAVVDQDRTSLSRQVTRYVGAHPSVDVVAVMPQPAQAQQLLWQGRIAGTLLIPSGFTEKILSGRQGQVALSGNGVYMMLNKAALNGLAEAVGTVSAGAEIKRLNAATPSAEQAKAQRQPLTVVTLPLFNVREGYGSYIVPGVMVLIIQQTLLIAMALMFGTWFESGGMPYDRSRAGYAGALAAFASVAFINILYFFGFVLWWQDYPRGGNVGGMLAMGLLFALSAAAFGLMVATLFRTRERSAQLLVATALPIMFLSGLTWPVEALPAPLQAVRWLLPSTSGIQAFIALNQLGAALSDVRQEAAALALLGLVSMLIGMARWRRLPRADVSGTPGGRTSVRN